MSIVDTKKLFPTIADRIVCINLVDRDDRMKEAQDQFDKVGLLGTVQFHRVERHPRGGRYGCYNSHREVMANALKDGLDSVLIFEDDVQFEDGWEEVVHDAKCFIDKAKNTNKQFDAFFLGSQILYVDEKVSTKVWRVKCCNSHAYIVSKSGMETWLANSERFERDILEYPQDMTQMSVWKHMYAHTSTDAIIQAPFLGTDNQWLPDIPEKYSPWFQMKVVIKLQEYIHPIIKNERYQKSWFGQTYVIGVSDKCIIDDGQVKLYPCPFVEYFFGTVLVLTTKPPFGYFALCHEFLWPVFFSRILPTLLSPLRWCYSLLFKVSVSKNN